MRSNGRWRFWLAILAAVWALAVLVQAAGGAQASSRAFLPSAAPGQGEQPVESSVVREIDDPHNGDHSGRWYSQQSRWFEISAGSESDATAGHQHPEQRNNQWERAEQRPCNPEQCRKRGIADGGRGWSACGQGGERAGGIGGRNLRRAGIGRSIQNGGCNAGRRAIAKVRAY